MSAVRLLVLGAVRRRTRAHGYQVRADLEAWGAHEWAGVKSGSVYHALKAMTGDGLLIAHDQAPSAAGGPMRTDYELAPAGDQEYFTLLRAALSDRDPRADVLAAAVGLIDDLTRTEAIALLRQRLSAMRTWRASVTEAVPPGTDLDTWGPVGEVLGLWIHTADSRAEWTRRLISRLETGAFKMADDAGGAGSADSLSSDNERSTNE